MLALHLLLHFILIASAHCVAQSAEAQVSTGDQFLGALNSTGVSSIVLDGDVRTTAEDTLIYPAPTYVGPNRTVNITSGGGTQWVLDFGNLAPLIYLQPNSTLRFTDLRLQGVARTPQGNATGLPTDMPDSFLWPTVSGASPHQVIFDRVRLEPVLESCTPAKVATWAQQLVAAPEFGPNALSYNGTMVQFNSAAYAVPILDGGSNVTEGQAQFRFINTTASFECATGQPVPQPLNNTAGSGSSSGQPAWLWPVVGGILGLAAVAASVGAVAVIRRRRQQQHVRRVAQGKSRGGKLASVEVSNSLGWADELNERSGASTHVKHVRNLSATMWHTRVGVIEGLELLTLIGTGSFGRCYKGRWRGAPVCVKVVEQQVMPGKPYDLCREPLLSMAVAHPNIVQSFRLQVVCIRTDADDGSQYTSSDAEKAEVAGSWGDAGSSGGRNGRHEQALELQSMQAAAEIQSSQTSGEGEHMEGRKCGGAGEVEPTAAATAAAQQSQHGNQPGVVMAAAGDVLSLPDGLLTPGLYEVWLVMEYCDRGNLSEAIAAGRFRNQATQELDQVCVLLSLLDIAQGLDYLHGTCNMLHGDLKGRNVLLKSARNDRRGFVCKLADFGLSRILGRNQTHIDTQSFGTATHAAPELLQHNKLTKASDVYSFAMIMWEMVAGEEPCQGMSSVQIVYQVVHQGYRPPLPEGCPEQLGRLMQRCWAADPQLRPAFEEVVQELRGMLAHSRRSLEVSRKQALGGSSSSSGAANGRREGTGEIATVATCI